MKKIKSYRIEGTATPGPDYVCSKCKVSGLRLWRQTHTMLDNVDLLCVKCATVSEAKNIAAYAHFHDPNSCGIGNLVPARPTPEGDTFWGHTSGDVEWWYALPQHLDPNEEAVLLRRERDYYVLQHQHSMAHELELYKKLAEARR